MTTSKTTRKTYPWDSLGNPCEQNAFNSRLVNGEDNPKGKRVFWAISWSGTPALIIDYKCQPWTPVSLPLFKNLLVIDRRDESSIIIELLDRDMRDFFLRVCLDIISAIQYVPDTAVRKASVLRLERWSAFLKPSRSRLSPEGQKGLIAELRFLQNDALATHEPSAALEGWTGPEAGPRDFAYGQLFVEVKSKRSSANPYITISSEEQLNVNSSERLYLFVDEINSATLDSDDAFTIADVVADVKSSFDSPIDRAELDSKLADAGYFEEDDYRESRWTQGETYYYQVIDGFPKIDSQSCDPGVFKVTYQIDLDYCEDYRIERNDLLNSME